MTTTATRQPITIPTRRRARMFARPPSSSFGRVLSHNCPVCGPRRAVVTVGWRPVRRRGDAVAEPRRVVTGHDASGKSVIRIIDIYPPRAGGKRTVMHRTQSLDYAVVIEGEVVHSG